MERNNRNFPCTMCYFSTVVENHLLHHYVRRHRFDPNFRVQCTVGDCRAAFSVWNSFRKHLQRKHRRQREDEPVNLGGNNEEDFHINNDEENLQDEHLRQLDALQTLQLQAARFLLHLREVCNTSHRAMQAVMEGATNLMNNHISVLMMNARRLAVDGYINVEDLQRCINTHPASVVFSHVQSKRKLDSFIVREMNFIEPLEIDLGQQLVWRKKPTVALVQRTMKGYRIPLLESLKRLLKNYDVRTCVENPREHQDGPMKSIMDGHYFKSHPFFSSTTNPLAIILYYDELEIVNPLGSRTHKLGMFYWSLANIYPEQRSSLKMINLYAIARYSHLKRAGIGKVLKEFAKEIIELQNEGVSVEVEGEHKNFKGSLLLVTGDTPAAAAVGGFKKSVSARRPCRRCMTDQDRLRLYFREEHFNMRTMESHLDQLEAISEPHTTAQVRNFWKVHYGVNEKSELLSIPHFDVTKCIPQDTMHILAEGVLERETRLCIQYCTETKHFITLEELNLRLQNFNYKHLTTDKPSVILPDHLKNEHLRQSASQMICLAHVLPFLISDTLIGEDGAQDSDGHAHLKCHIKLLQIMNVCFAYEVSVDDAHFLTTLIENFLMNYVELYGYDALVPKFHFLIHVVQQIVEFGPLRQHFCFRFEAAHARHKFLARVVRCFKNMPLTLTYRDEIRRCLNFSLEHEPQTRFMYQGHTIKSGSILQLVDFDAYELLVPHFPGVNIDECQITLSPEVSIWGASFKKRTVILLECIEDDLPKFGLIHTIVTRNKTILFLHQECDTLLYDENLNAYSIRTPNENAPKAVVNIENMDHLHPLSIFSFQRAKYVVLFNHTRTEFLR